MEGRNSKYIIDFIVYTHEMRTMFKEVKIMAEAETGSEHRLVKVDQKLELN